MEYCDFCNNMCPFVIKVATRTYYACKTCYDEFAAQYARHPKQIFKVTLNGQEGMDKNGPGIPGNTHQ